MALIRRLILILIALSLIIPGSAVATTTPTGQNTSDCISTNDDSQSREVTATLTQPENTTDTIRISYSLKKEQTHFTVRLPDASKVISKKGFRREGPSELAYNGSADPYIEYKMLNQFPKWTPVGSTRWTFSPKPEHEGIQLNYKFEPNGVAGDTFLYIGNYTMISESIGCHTISLVVSEESKSRINEEQVHESLVYAAKDVKIGHRYDEVTIFAIPRAPDPRYGGYAWETEAWMKTTGDREKNSRVAIHEYLHTRTVLDNTGITGMLWFTEGSVDYLSYKTGYEQGVISAGKFNGVLKKGSTENSALTNRSTWDSEFTKYSRGTAFVAILDYKLRDVTNGSYGVEDMLKQINNVEAKTGVINIRRNRFLDRIENHSSSSVREWANSSIDSKQEFQYESARFEPRYYQSLREQIAERSSQNPINTLIVWITIGFMIGVLVTEKRIQARKEDADEKSNDHPNRVS